MNFKLKKPGFQEGITLIEVMIAVLLFGIALGAVVYSLQLNLTNADQLRNNTVAAGLAQEGIEIVRNIRDREWISPSASFGTNIPDGVYEVQWDDTALSSSQSRFLKKDSSSGLYSYGLGNDTIFKRTITITTAGSNEKVITVLVSWSLRGADHSITAEDHLYNWY